MNPHRSSSAGGQRPGGSNDLTQLLLGADRDNEVLAETFDERDPAVTAHLLVLLDAGR